MAYLKGNYDPANPPAADGSQSMAPPDDLNFNPSDAVDGMHFSEVDDMAGMIDLLGGDDQPPIARSSFALEPTEPV